MRPEFWQDEDIAAWPEGLRLFYIGLWGIADDAGFFDYNVARIAGDLYRYDEREPRETVVAERLKVLTKSKHVVRHKCGHAEIPALPRHQRVGGNPTYTIRDRHKGCDVRIHQVTANSPRNVKGREGNGREREVISSPADNHAASASGVTVFSQRVPRPPR